MDGLEGGVKKRAANNQICTPTIPFDTLLTGMVQVTDLKSGLVLKYVVAENFQLTHNSAAALFGDPNWEEERSQPIYHFI